MFRNGKPAPFIFVSIKVYEITLTSKFNPYTSTSTLKRKVKNKDLTEMRQQKNTLTGYNIFNYINLIVSSQLKG